MDFALDRLEKQLSQFRMGISLFEFEIIPSPLTCAPITQCVTMCLDKFVSIAIYIWNATNRNFSRNATRRLSPGFFLRAATDRIGDMKNSTFPLTHKTIHQIHSASIETNNTCSWLGTFLQPRALCSANQVQLYSRHIWKEANLIR